MDWSELKKEIYYLDGSWRDIYVLQTNRRDWEKWVDYVNENYRVDWFNCKTEKEEQNVDFSVIEEYWNGAVDLRSSANVFVDKIQINAHFFTESEIENDIDPREFNSIDDHHKLINYLANLSKLLNKQVILTPEDTPETILMKIDENSVKYY